MMKKQEISPGLRALGSQIPEALFAGRPELSVQIHTDLAECRELWNRFSPEKSIYHLWEFREAWLDVYHYELFFYTIYEYKEPIALLPLWYSPDDHQFEFFGGWWLEDNGLFARDGDAELLVSLLPAPGFLNAVELTPSQMTGRVGELLEPDHPKSYLPLGKYPSIDAYLKTLSKKHRYNLLADYRRILAQNPRVTEYPLCEFSRTAPLFALNKQRFDGEDREKSYFFNEGDIRGYDYLFQRAGRYSYKIIEVTIGSELAAIDLIMTYNGRYYLMTGANNLERFRGIGYFMIYYEIEDSMKNGFEILDCSQIDYGWKHRYFEQKPMYKIRK